MRYLLVLLNISSVYGLCDWYYGHWQPKPHQCFDLVTQELGVSLELIQYMNFDKDLNIISSLNIYNVPLSTKPLKFATWTDDCPPRLVLEEHRTCESSDSEVSKAHQKTADAKTVPSPSSSADATETRPTGSIATSIADPSKTLNDASSLGTAKDSEVTKDPATLLSTTNRKVKTETSTRSKAGSLSKTDTTKKKTKPTTSHGATWTKSGEKSDTVEGSSRPSKTTEGASTTTSEGKVKQAATSNTSKAETQTTTQTDTAKVTTIRTSVTKAAPKATPTEGSSTARTHQCGLAKDYPGHARVSKGEMESTAKAWCAKNKIRSAIMSAESKKLKAVMKGYNGVLYEYSVRWMDNCRWTDQKVSFPLNDDKKITCSELIAEFAWQKYSIQALAMKEWGAQLKPAVYYTS
ncbi:uncharacterized protein FFNC_15591 [Fusarium fujikuroi]|nr:uncharacterized protein FFNC_15591 [Fusarium fujikuroi]